MALGLFNEVNSNGLILPFNGAKGKLKMCTPGHNHKKIRLKSPCFRGGFLPKTPSFCTIYHGFYAEGFPRKNEPAASALTGTAP
jgi:hypothetical protein